MSVKRGEIYYEEKKRNKDKLTYTYYSTATGEEAFTISVGGI